MTTVRPFTHDDAPAVASLYERVMRSKTERPPPLLAPALVRYFLDHPWADPEIPALVCEDRQGRLQGFIGSTVRRLIFNGRPVRLGCSGPLLRAPEAAAGMAGALLLRAYLAGPQDLSITDGANADGAKLWVGLGGRVVDLPSLEWVKALRPAAHAVAAAFDRARLAPLKPVARRLGSPLDALMVKRRGGVAPDRTFSEVLSVDALVEHAEEGMGWANLRPAYDRPFVSWLFSEMDALPSRGPLLRRLVRDGNGKVAGWYVAFLPPNGIADVLQVVARPRMGGTVLDDLFHHVKAHQGIAVIGRLEPALLAPLKERRAKIRHTFPALIHTRHHDILAAIALGEAVLTRMDGEWWLPLHSESYQRDTEKSPIASPALV
ncbi:hypothetical protein [Azospirillum sp. sgz302134]